MQFFTGFEANGFARSDADFGAGSRIAADAGFACANAEDSEATEFDAFASCQCFLESFKHSVDCRFGLGSGQACAFDHMVHDVLFNQSGHLACATVLDCTTPYRTDGTAFGSFVEHRGRGFFAYCDRKREQEPFVFPVIRLTTWNGHQARLTGDWRCDFRDRRSSRNNT